MNVHAFPHKFTMKENAIQPAQKEPIKKGKVVSNVKEDVQFVMLADYVSHALLDISLMSKEIASASIINTSSLDHVFLLVQLELIQIQPLITAINATIHAKIVIHLICLQTVLVVPMVNTIYIYIANNDYL